MASIALAVIGMCAHTMPSASAFQHEAQARYVGQYKQESTIAPLQKLAGHLPPMMASAKRQGRVDAAQNLELTLALPLQNEAELNKTLEDMYNPASPTYRHFLSNDEYNARFRANAQQIATVRSYLAQHNITLAEVHGSLVKASGAVRDIEAAFHTELYNYVDAHGQKFFAPAYELQIPAGLPLRAVHGLHTPAQAHKHLVRNPNPVSAHDDSLVASMHTHNAAAIRQVYNVPASATGAGQTVALVELDGYVASDVAQYCATNRINAVPLRNVLMDGADGSAGSGADEVTLDIELINALAPNLSQIVVYEAPNSNMVDILNEIANPTVGDRTLIRSISNSWGTAETYLSQSDVSTDYTVLKQLAAQGQTFFSASGDSGAEDDGSDLSIDEPGAQPYAISTGGTTLYDSSSGYGHESAWSDGGGGISIYWSIPTWQNGVISAASGGSTSMRNVPDVSLDADSGSGYSIFVGGTWGVFGGTSCAAPLWAAFLALANAERAQANMPPLGFAAPTLYQIGQSSSYESDFHDIADGSNNGYYPAVSGYDNATGWGTFQGSALLNTLSEKSCSNAAPTVTVATNQSEAVGDRTVHYTVNVQNHDSGSCGSATLSIEAHVQGVPQSKKWPTATIVLAPGASGSVNVSNSLPAALPQGSYTLLVTATNSSTNLWGSASDKVLVK